MKLIVPPHGHAVHDTHAVWVIKGHLSMHTQWLAHHRHSQQQQQQVWRQLQQQYLLGASAGRMLHTLWEGFHLLSGTWRLHVESASAVWLIETLMHVEYAQTMFGTTAAQSSAAAAAGLASTAAVVLTRQQHDAHTMVNASSTDQQGSHHEGGQ